MSKEYSRTFYFSPDDDVQDAFLAFVNSAKTSIRLADFSFNLPALVDILIAKHQAGVDVQLVLDRSQSAGPTEVPQIERLRAAGVPLVIGTSDQHRIMHDKFLIVDGEAVLYGSYNFTVAAQKESNFIVTENNTDLAALFTAAFTAIQSWIVANCKQ
jgi:phosphatidylserine/phosphatidylglycerophosphate/cardiolipin synthase-like enzyme